MKTEISKIFIVFGSIIATAMLLVCLMIMIENKGGLAEVKDDINILALGAERVLCFSVFSAFFSDVLLHKKAR